MQPHKKYWVFITIIVMLCLSAFSPMTADSELINNDLKPILSIRQNQENKDWDQIIQNAFQSLGLEVNPDSGNYQNAVIKPVALRVSLDNGAYSVYFAVYENTPNNQNQLFQSTESVFEDCTFHGLQAKCATSYTTIDNSPYSNALYWEMNNYILLAVYFSESSLTGDWDRIYRYADAFYYATNNINPDQPDDLCSDVTCQNNYCNEDGTRYFHDCGCNAATGSCDCEEDVCTSGCDKDENGCKPDICTNITCLDKCENNYSYKAGSCDPKNGECIYSESVDCGLAGCDPVTNLCRTLNDLSIKKVILVQAVEGGMLIAQKPTAIVVEFEWPDPNINAEVGVSLFIDGSAFQTIRQVVKNSYQKNEKYHNEDVSVFHIPAGVLSSGNHNFQVEAVLLDDKFIDNNLSNNTYSQTTKFTASRSITLLYAGQSGVSHAQMVSFHSKARSFLLNVFPVIDVKWLRYSIRLMTANRINSKLLNWRNFAVFTILKMINMRVLEWVFTLTANLVKVWTDSVIFGHAEV